MIHPKRAEFASGFLSHWLRWTCSAIGVASVASAVAAGPAITYNKTGQGLTMTWATGYRLEQNTTLSSNGWEVVSATSPFTATTDAAPTHFYRLSQIPSGFNLQVQPVNLFAAEGQMIRFPGGQVTLQPSTTNYVVLDLQSHRLHVLKRFIHSGGVLLAKAVTDSHGITTVDEVPFPSISGSFIERTKAKLRNNESIRVVALGDSLFLGLNSPSWFARIFDNKQAAGGFNLPNVNKVTAADYSLGSQSANFGLMQLGTSIGQGNPSLFDHRTLGVMYGPYYSTYLNSQGSFQTSPILSSSPDLLVVSFLNNSTYKLNCLEAIVREARRNGVEVILIAAHPTAEIPNRAEGEGPLLAAIAATHGCELVDCWSYMHEAIDAGQKVFLDGVHQNDLGHQIWAEAVRSVFNDLPQEASVVEANDRHVVMDGPGTTGFRFLETTDMAFTPHSTTGKFGPVRANSFAAFTNMNPALLYGGKSTANCVLELHEGDTAVFSHPAALAMDLLIESGPAFTANIRMQTTTNIVTYNGSDTTPQPQVVEALNMLQMSALSPLTQWGFSPDVIIANAAIQIQCTSGTLRLIGVAFHGFRKREVEFGEFGDIGNWNVEPGFWIKSHRYTDTPGDSSSLSFFGRGMMLIFQGGPRAGIVELTVDGKRTSKDLYLAAPNYSLFHHMIFPDLDPVTSSNELVPRWHTVTMRLTGANTNAIETAPGLRRLSLNQAYIIGPE